MEKLAHPLCVLLRSAVTAQPLTDAQRAYVGPHPATELLALARAHDVAHLLAVALALNELEGAAELRRERMVAAYRCEQLTYVLDEVSLALEDAHIPHIPLKGAVMRRYYREPWLRTGSDVDILIHESDLPQALNCLCDCGYVNHGRGTHDVTLLSPSGYHLELHYDLIEDGRVKRSASLLQDCWAHATACEGYVYRQALSDAMFYLHHMAHMAKHFEAGGCGVRPFVDLWLLDRSASADTAAARDALLVQADLLTFAEAARALCRVWFDLAPHTPRSYQMQAFVLQGGMYGSRGNFILLQRRQPGDHRRYVLSRLFLPYETMKYEYPVLQKHPWLLPLMHVRRWFSRVLHGRLGHAVQEVKLARRIDATQAARVQKFLDDIGL